MAIRHSIAHIGEGSAIGGLVEVGLGIRLGARYTTGPDYPAQGEAA
jgi:hypothetical protein